jgi:NAD(P)-dependent dehydrogenase (short-subunit alcohol dehydrogenase family)
MRIAIVDGQGGGIGKALVTALCPLIAETDEIIVLGTNSSATVAMLKGGVKTGASGENAIVVNAGRVDVIAGPIAIVAANSLLGEVTPAIARAISESPATKILIPMDRCGIIVAGSTNLSFQEKIDDAIACIMKLRA